MRYYDQQALLWSPTALSTNTKTQAPRDITSTSSQFEPWHGISNNVVNATSKASDQPAHMRSLIRALASRLKIL